MSFCPGCGCSSLDHGLVRYARDLIANCMNCRTPCWRSAHTPFLREVERRVLGQI